MRPREGPKSVENRVQGCSELFPRYLDFRLVFEPLSELQKSNLFRKMTPPKRPQNVAPEWSKCHQNLMKIHVSNACESSFSLSFYRCSWPSRCWPNCGANCPYKCLFFGAEKVPLGPIFVLLDPSRQFVGDLERAQDGPQIAPKWSQERFAERKGGSSIC